MSLLDVWPAQSPVPAHSPYQLADWVRCHGYPGSLPGPRQWGWRGYVTGCYGATILRGLTDDGHPWSENWGALVPDGEPNRSAASCTCCPNRRTRQPPGQLDLFGRSP